MSKNIEKKGKNLGIFDGLKGDEKDIDLENTGLFQKTPKAKKIFYFKLKDKYTDFIKPALKNTSKYTCIKAGRRTGKTYNSAIWLVNKLIENPESNAIWVDTSQNNLDSYITRYFKKILKSIWGECNYNKKKLTLTLFNGSYIDFRSAERPELLEGFEYNYAVLNEAGIILKSPDLWFNTLQPMCKDAQVKIIGTPKGKNLFHTLYYQGLNSDNTDWESFSYSASESPYWTEKALNKIKKTVPQEVWKQEYQAEFLEGAGAVFRNINNCIIDLDTNYIINNTQYVMGIDIAKHTDFTVIYIAEKNTKKIIFQDRFNQVDWSFQKNRILNIWEKFNKPQTIIDSTGVGDAIYDDLCKQGMQGYLQGFKFNNNNKSELIHNLSVAIDNQEIFFMNFPELISELETFEYTVSSAGLFRYSAPSGLHDDCVIALALVYKLLQKDKQTPMMRIIELKNKFKTIFISPFLGDEDDEYSYIEKSLA